MVFYCFISVINYLDEKYYIPFTEYLTLGLVADEARDQP